MKFLGALLILIVCLASFASSTSIREKRQWGRYPPPPYRPRPFGPRRPAVVVQKTVVYRG
ncbi:hypothetical protein ANCCAN_05539 [Ancylostoma caninum]|uniref:Uncharacterized protein n=1 Tax=Ancylostoma caninum TaxID=29170 RepID=A0A368GVK9_ANCCA|nr:hypothetical protein ANCCAN_05539 [Ancylostoma caninum]